MTVLTSLPAADFWGHRGGALTSALPGMSWAVAGVTGSGRASPSAARDEALSAFYRARDFEGIWTGRAKPMWCGATRSFLR